MKGSQPAGSTTTTTINPTQQAQLPFLQDLWGQTQGLGQTNPMQYYPNATLSQWGTPEKTTGYQNMYNNAYNTNANLPIVNAAYNTAVTGGYGAGINPANPYYQDYASGGGPSQQMQQGLYGQGLSQGGQYAQQVGQYSAPIQQMAYQLGANNNLGLSQLGNTASGMYLNSNPYMAQMVQSAMDPVTRNYQTAIAPSTDAMFSGGGRYGSGAMAGAVSTGQQNLARGLSDLSGNLYGQQYARERQAQDAAAQNYGQLYNAGLAQGMQGLGNAANIQGAAGNQYWAGQRAAQDAANQYAQGGQFGAGGLNSMFNTGNLAAMEALRMYPQLAGAQNIGAQQQVAAGTGLAAVDQARIADEMARFYGQQKAPWDTLTNMSGLFGQPTGGSSSVSQPYFQNQGANLLSGLTGAASLGNQFGLFGSGGLGGLGGSGLAGIGAGNLTGPAAMAGFDTLGGTIGMGALGADFGGGGAAMASFLPFLL
jgi:hypothetical protein